MNNLYLVYLFNVLIDDIDDIKLDLLSKSCK